MRNKQSERLRPTLWRTCRTLANRTRLKMIRALLVKPGMSVTEVAYTFRMNLAVASKYLRELNARGLLKAERRLAEVRYWPVADNSVPQARWLLIALSDIFRSQKSSVDFVFRKATAFTHPRRISIIRILLQKPSRFEQIRMQTGMSKAALKRHLRKLVDRGFVGRAKRDEFYEIIAVKSLLEIVFLKLAKD